MLTKVIEGYRSELLNIDLEIYKDEEGVFWFHGATLCDVFELPNPSQSIQRHVDDDWRKKFPSVHGRESWYVMEPGFYQLLHASKHPAAKRFQRWVYAEVLPKLRADGGYIMSSVSDEQYQVLRSQLSSANLKCAYLRELAEYNRLEGVSVSATRLHQSVLSWDFRLNTAARRKWYNATAEQLQRESTAAREAMMAQRQAVDLMRLRAITETQSALA